MISQRMSAICALLNNADTVADVGCDHGYVAIEIIKNKKARRAICSDVRKGPLSKATEHISEASLNSYIECRLSDGVKSYTAGEIDALIIAGMGGPLIQKILDEGKSVITDVKQFVFSPQSDIESFRKYLYASGIEIEEENIIKEDGKFYFIMRASYGKAAVDSMSVLEYRYGKNLLKDRNPVLKEFLEYENAQLNSLLKTLETGEIESRIAEVKVLLKDNTEALELYEVCRNN